MPSIYGEAGLTDEAAMPSLETSRHVTRHVTSPGGDISNTPAGGKLVKTKLNSTSLAGPKFQRKYGRSYRRKKRA
ncbi:MAG: hypothetical protein ACHQC8_02515 [Solirubrobacterales bacterium]